MQRSAVSLSNRAMLAAANIEFVRRRGAVAHMRFRRDKSAMLATANIELKFGFSPKGKEESTKRRSRQGDCRR